MMNKITRNDFTQEIAATIRAAKSGVGLSKLLKRYHERDVAKALSLLTETERERVLRLMDVPALTAVFPYLDDAAGCLAALTAQDLVELVDDAMGDDYAKLGGLTSKEDLRESVFVSMKKRLPWLIVLLFLGMGVSSVVGVFESVVAVLPIVICFQSLVLVFLIDVFRI